MLGAHWNSRSWEIDGERQHTPLCINMKPPSPLTLKNSVFLPGIPYLQDRHVPPLSCALQVFYQLASPTHCQLSDPRVNNRWLRDSGARNHAQHTRCCQMNSFGQWQVITTFMQCKSPKSEISHQGKSMDLQNNYTFSKLKTNIP